MSKSAAAIGPGGAQTSGKRPGKTKNAIRRRQVTRRSGFRVHAETTGGEFQRVEVQGHRLERGSEARIAFRFPAARMGSRVGYGVWFLAGAGVSVKVSGGPERFTQTDYSGRSWNKLGSIWTVEDDDAPTVVVSFTASRAGDLVLFQPSCGIVHHKYLEQARPALLRNMYQFAPEAVFVEDSSGSVDIGVAGSSTAAAAEILLKSCNRCGRYLPFNCPAERDHLSFSNHCVAEHRRPCRHSSFGRLKNTGAEGKVELDLEYGFQLECRFCKKFEVNAAHNPRRTAAQMKEDGARRRAFEALLAELYGGASQLRYRLRAGTDLADDVWKRFGRKCFKCGERLSTVKTMHLDHTRPLALLWPLDATATALCGSCNSQKRDRPPAEFYSAGELHALSELTGIALGDLRRVGPNEDALARLIRRRHWFFSDFLQRAEMAKVRDGKVTRDLVLKALRKVFMGSARHRRVDLLAEYRSFSRAPR